MSWTDERVETLKRMWAEGQSASQIAKELGGVTRNAVIGKVHRLGLSNRVGGKGDEDEATPAAATAPAADFRAAAERPAPERAAPPAGGATVTPLPTRKAIIPAGQPLPPQPSANEISPEALLSPEDYFPPDPFEEAPSDSERDPELVDSPYGPIRRDDL